ncbi:unnamed protein product, partial [Mesorhabditis spiculigera]
MSSCEINDGYKSEEDEDYVPEKEEEEAPLEQSGIQGGRGQRNKPKSAIAPKTVEEKSVTAEDCSADFLDDLFGITAPSSSTSRPPTTKPSVENKVVSAVDKVKANTTLITEVYDYAGEEVRLEREVTEQEYEKIKAKEEKAKSQPPKRRTTDMGVVLEVLTKKKKMSALDKTSLDWNAFKKEKNLTEELETFNKGRDGYLKKMQFLNDADQRQFEKEKELRKNIRK